MARYFFGRVLGTTVTNPSHRYGRSAYSECQHCHRLYTQQGISRHWDKCPMNPKNLQKDR